jgi:hypothetical protein
MNLVVGEEKVAEGAAAESGAASPTTRSLVLVAGSGRSGTSLFTGILQRLGFHVPQPEVVPDETNPRGFAESQWVVDFHTRLLKRAGVRVSDARPAAWGLVADVGVQEEPGKELRAWLQKELDTSDHVIIKDPRLSWFLPLWRRCAEELGVTPRAAIVLRHPAAVIDSKQRWYGGWHGDVGHTADWLNASLFTERATRDMTRALVRYDDLLDDWTKAIGRVGESLDLAVIRDAPAPKIVRVHEFVDRSLSRSRSDWEGVDLPTALREQADRAWGLLCELAVVDGAPPAELTDKLDAARAAYIALYEEAEAIAHSSIVARARPETRRKRRGATLRVAAKVPRRYRDLIPVGWRRAGLRALSRGR